MDETTSQLRADNSTEEFLGHYGNRELSSDVAEVTTGVIEFATAARDTFKKNGKTPPLASNGEKIETAERMEAREYFERHLAKNVQVVQTLREMKDIIGEFSRCGLVMLVWKCVDGRVHGSKGKGYPIGTITFARSEGANIDINSMNTRLWEVIESAITDAELRTPDMPAVVIILGHCSKSDPHHLSCAAKDYDEGKALATVAEQTNELRKVYYSPDHGEHYDRNNVVFMHGMTNTDDMSETLYFEHGEHIDSSEIISVLGLQHPSEIFSEEFLLQPIHDPLTKKYTGDAIVRDLLEGNEAPIYQNLPIALAMQAYLIRHVNEIVNKGGKDAEKIFSRNVYNMLSEQIDNVKDLPPSIKGPLLYQFLWNTAYALYQRNRLENMDANEREQHLDHAEDLVCYGEGFETVARNKALLVKPGRGDEIKALSTARKVLLKYSPKKNIPMVHINVELTERPTSWDSYRTNVRSKLQRMKGYVGQVFGSDVSIMCTYSYKNEKQFYPVANGRKDVRECVQHNIIKGFNSPSDFSAPKMTAREDQFTSEMLDAFSDK